MRVDNKSNKNEEKETVYFCITDSRTVVSLFFSHL